MQDVSLSLVVFKKMRVFDLITYVYCESGFHQLNCACRLLRPGCAFMWKTNKS